MLIPLTEEQYGRVRQKWNLRNSDEFSWICDICKSKVAGDGDMIAQVGGPASRDGIRGNIVVMKICTVCRDTLSVAISARSVDK